MSGHSKWSQIKRQKAVTDNKRGNLFTKLGNAIAVAAKQGGADQSGNFKLRLTIEKARAANMPNNNIERAIKRGSGELADQSIEEIIYEAYGPGGTAIIIEAATDNKNRTTATVRKILSKYGGKLGNNGCVMWMFANKGVIRILKDKIKNKDEFELAMIDAGAQDIIEEDEGFIIFTAPQDISSVQKDLDSKNITTESAELEMIPQNKINLSKESHIKSLNKIFLELEADDDINNYFSNANL